MRKKEACLSFSERETKRAWKFRGENQLCQKGIKSQKEEGAGKKHGVLLRGR